MTLQWKADDDEEQKTEENAMDIENVTDEGCQVIQLQRLTKLAEGISGGRGCTFVPIPESMITLLSKEEFPRDLQIKAYDANHRFRGCELSCTVVAGAAKSVLIREKGNESEYSSIYHVDVTGSSKRKFELKLLDALQLPASFKSMKHINCTMTIENDIPVYSTKQIKKEIELKNIQVDFKTIHESHPNLFDIANGTEFKLTCTISYESGSGKVTTNPCYIMCRVMTVNCVSAISVIRLSDNGDETQKNKIRCGDVVKCVVKMSTQNKVPYIMSLDEVKQSIAITVYKGAEIELRNIYPVYVNHRDGSLVYDFNSFKTPGKYRLHIIYTEQRSSIIEEMQPTIPPQVCIYTTKIVYI